MRIPYKTKLLVAFGIITVVFIAGCVDTNVNPIPDSIDYSSQIKVVNLVSGAGDATLSLNGQSLGTAAFGTEVPASSGFLTIPAGSKTLTATYSVAGGNETYQFATATEYKIRAFLVGTSAASEVVLFHQRYIWQTKDSDYGKTLFPADTGWVAFFNGSPDAVLNTVSINGDETDLGGLSAGNGYKYIKLPAGAYTFEVTYNDTLSTSFTYDVASKGRYTAVIYDASASIKNAVFVDD